jgi:hypothetical protein
MCLQDYLPGFRQTRQFGKDVDPPTVPRPGAGQRALHEGWSEWSRLAAAAQRARPGRECRATVAIGPL